MKRLPDWPQRLDAVIVEATAKPFRYGAFDCCLFAADAVRAMTGVDPAQSWRGCYRGLRGALQMIRREGDVPAIVTSRLGIAPLEGHAARRGDLVWRPGPPAGYGAVGVCIGLHCVYPSDRGLAFMPRDEGRLYWMVG